MMKLFSTLGTRPSLRRGRLCVGMTLVTDVAVIPAKAGIQSADNLEF